MAQKKQSRVIKKKKARRHYEKPRCTSEQSFGSLILGCSFTDCGANSAFK